MALPKFLQSALWSYDLTKMNIKNKTDRKIIVEQILNHGTWKQLKWLRNQYSDKILKEIIQNPSRGIWHFDALNYWQIILGIKLPKQKIKRALFSLNS